MAEPALLFADVLKQQNRMFYGSDDPSQIDDYVANSAKRIHSLMIWDASQNAFFEAATLSSALVDDSARYFVQFGAARRLEMIWYAYQNLASVAPPDRTEPLQADESRQLMLDLNTIYLNIRGVLDNFAWALLHQFAPDHLRALRPSQVGFFLPCINSNPIFGSLHHVVELHDAWDRDLKARRDPAAHRIPLALPPAVLAPDEITRYRELEAEYNLAIQHREFQLSDQILDAQRKIGRFHPWFIHEPAHGPIEIYPTVPDDIAHIVQIFGPVREYIVQRGPSAPQG